MRDRMNNRRDFIKTLGAGCLTLMAPAVQSQPFRPHIVIIMADDMGYSDIGCYGGEIATPHLDSLAGNGVRFTQFYNTARCCPTRASLLTGLYSHQAGIGHMVGDLGKPSYQGYLNRNCVTIAEVLQSAGYSTYMAGKWHVGNKPGYWPLDRGFERFYGSNNSTGHYFRINDDKNDRRLIQDDQEVEPTPGWYATDAYTDAAIQYVKQHESDNPFFLYLAYTAPHWPLHALPEDIQKYRGRYREGWDALREERYRRMIQLGLIQPDWPLSPGDEIDWDELSEEEREELDLRMAVYAAMVDRMDQNIGRLIDTLKQKGIFENTLILFLSDNGGSAEGGDRGFTRTPGETGTPESYASYGRCWANASDTPFRLYKSWTHEGGIATPLIGHWPQGIQAKGSITHQTGHVIDLMATCCDVAGAEYPESYQGNSIIPMEGKSLLPILQGKQREGHEALCWEHEGNQAIRMGDWKLVRKHRGAWELYHLQADRTELNDLAAAHPERVREMEQHYQDWMNRCGVQPWPLPK